MSLESEAAEQEHNALEEERLICCHNLKIAETESITLQEVIPVCFIVCQHHAMRLKGLEVRLTCYEDPEKED